MLVVTRQKGVIMLPPVTSTYQPEHFIVDLTDPNPTPRQQVKNVYDQVKTMQGAVHRLYKYGSLTMTHGLINNEIENLNKIIQTTDAYINDMRNMIKRMSAEDRKNMLPEILNTIKLAGAVNEQARLLKTSLTHKNEEIKDSKNRHLSGKATPEQLKTIKDIQNDFYSSARKIENNLLELDRNNTLKLARETLNDARQLRDRIYASFGNKHYDFPVINKLLAKLFELSMKCRAYVESAELNSSQQVKRPLWVDSTDQTSSAKKLRGSTQNTQDLQNRFTTLESETQVQVREIDQAMGALINLRGYDLERARLELYYREARLYHNNINQTNQIREELTRLQNGNPEVGQNLQRQLDRHIENMNDDVDLVNNHINQTLEAIYTRIIAPTRDKNELRHSRIVQNQLTELRGFIAMNADVFPATEMRERINDSLTHIGQRILQIENERNESAKSMTHRLNEFTGLIKYSLETLQTFYPLPDNVSQLKNLVTQLEGVELEYIDNINIFNEFQQEVTNSGLESNDNVTNQLNYIREQLRVLKERTIQLRSAFAERLHHSQTNFLERVTLPEPYNQLSHLPDPSHETTPEFIHFDFNE